MRIISFKFSGDYAHFRRHYTTSSPLTHSIPPPSALRGLVGAIMGFSQKKYTEKLAPDEALFGIRLLRPIKKIRLGMNYMDTKDGGWAELDLKRMRPKPAKDTHGGWRLHTQVRLELLKDPSFEIFFHHKDDFFMDELAQRLKAHETIFTPYLGITECIANFEFLWDSEVQPFDGIADVVSAFRLDSLKELKLSDGTGIVKEVIPCFITNERIRISDCEVAFNPHARPIKAKVQGALFLPGKEDQIFTLIG